MKIALTLVLASLAATGEAYAQGRPVDWPILGGDAQRTGWEKSDSRITKSNVKDFRLVLKHKLENNQSGPFALTPPVVIGMLISYRGFKELAFVSGSSDNIWSLDADLETMFWKKHFATSGRKPGSTCAAAATPSLIPARNFSATPRPSPAVKPALAFLNPAGFGEPRPVFALSSDGKLRSLNTATGDDLAAPFKFLPPGVKASTLTFTDGVIYTTTTSSCGGRPDAVWALDLNSAEPNRAPRVSTFAPHPGSLPALGGVALGNDGTVYTQTSESFIALSPGDLKMKQYFTYQAASTGRKRDKNVNIPVPVVFKYNNRDLIASAGSDGRIYLLDGQSPGGEDHKTPLSQTPPIASPGHGVWGGLSTSEDAAGVRWVFAPVWGPVSAELASTATNGPAPNGSVVAFRIEDHDGKPILTPAWVSRDMASPEPPVITAGTVFALSAGGHHATLFALDAATGKEVYSTGDQVTAPGSLTGIAIANGRVYFTTTDNTLYAFGIYLER